MFLDKEFSSLFGETPCSMSRNVSGPPQVEIVGYKIKVSLVVIVRKALVGKPFYPNFIVSEM